MSDMYDAHEITNYVYIYDEQNEMEIIAEHTKSSSYEEDEDGEWSSSTKHHSIWVEKKLPLGQLLLEVISYDEKTLRRHWITHFIENAVDMVEPEPMVIPGVLDFMSFGRDDDSPDWLFSLNCIAIIKEYLSLCNTYPAMAGFEWIAALWDVFERRDFQLEHECHIFAREKGRRYEWDERHERERDSSREGQLDPEALYIDVSNLYSELSHRVGYYLNETGTQYPLHAWKIQGDDIVGLLLMSLENCHEKQVKFIKCKNCGEFFIPAKRSDTIYCDRQAPQDTSKTCKEYGARQA